MTDHHSQNKHRPRKGARYAFLFFVLSVSLGLSLLFKLTHPDADAIDSPEEGRTATVKRVFDGDTFALRHGTKVRMIGVDALDSHNFERVIEQSHKLGMPTKTVHKWSAEATSWLREELAQGKVTLEYGPEKEDKYGRLLAYVYRENEGTERDINRRLIEKGLATATRAFPHPHRKEFIRCEKKARRNNRGLWKDATRQYR